MQLIFKTIILIYTFLEIYSEQISNNVIVETKYGKIRGFTDEFFERKIDTFLGIPFAEPPIRDLRFRPPKPISKWNNIIDTTKFKNGCIQPKTWLYTGPTDEDCLYLNVWSPKSLNSQPKSVMLWIHGGSFIAGAASVDQYDGRAIAAVGDVIVVTVNYRLGAFGFFSGGNVKGNNGLRDMTMAIQWTKDNIAAFGGDFNKITIFGESAGAYSVGLLLISPLSRNLIKRAIMQSGAPYHYFGAEEPTFASMKAVQMSKHFSCLNNNTIADMYWDNCLRKRDANQINQWTVNYLIDNSTGSVINTQFLPIYGDDFLPNKPLDAMNSGDFRHDIQLLIGSNDGEGSYFGLKYFPLQFDPFNPENFTKSEAKYLINECLRKFIFVPSISDNIANHYLENISENDYIGLRTAVASAIGDYIINCPTDFFAERFAWHSQNGKVYDYYMTHRSSKRPFFSKCSGWMKVCHAEDLTFVFGLPLRYPQMYSKDDYDFSLDIIHKWTNFAKTGNPLASDGSFWPSFERNVISHEIVKKYMELNPHVKNHVTINPRKNECWNFWKKYIDSGYSVPFLEREEQSLRKYCYINNLNLFTSC